MGPGVSALEPNSVLCQACKRELDWSEPGQTQIVTTWSAYLALSQDLQAGKGEHLCQGGTCDRPGKAEVPGSRNLTFSHIFQGESVKAAAAKSRSNHRARSKRGSRARASKDTSKLLLLYDEDILERDPLREQKDLAFAQAYLTRVGRCCFLLLPVPGMWLLLLWGHVFKMTRVLRLA